MDRTTTAHVARVAAHHRAPSNAAQTLLIDAFLRDAHQIPQIEPTAQRGTALHRARVESLARSYRHGLAHCADPVGFLLSIYNTDADRLEAEARAAEPLGDRIENWLFDTMLGRAALAAVAVAVAALIGFTAAPGLVDTAHVVPTPMGKAAP